MGEKVVVCSLEINSMEKDPLETIKQIIDKHKDNLSLLANSLALFTEIYDKILDDQDDSYSELKKKVAEHRDALYKHLMKEIMDKN